MHKQRRFTSSGWSHHQSVELFATQYTIERGQLGIAAAKHVIGVVGEQTLHCATRRYR
jgi:hypothetical protein